MIIGFNIDDVLRNTSERIYGFYLKEHPNNDVDIKVNLSDIQGSLNMNDEEYKEFIEDYLLEIYGSTADQYKNSNKDFNALVNFLNENGHEVVIIQEETGKIRSATLYFLSDRCLDVNSIFFINDILDIRKKCDIFVTANPKHLMIEDLKTVKVNRVYNKDINKENSINEIKDLFNLFVNDLNK